MNLILEHLEGILLMAEILHQLTLVVYPIIYKVLYIPGGAGFLNHEQYVNFQQPQKIGETLNHQGLILSCNMVLMVDPVCVSNRLLCFNSCPMMTSLLLSGLSIGTPMICA